MFSMSLNVNIGWIVEKIIRIFFELQIINLFNSLAADNLFKRNLVFQIGFYEKENYNFLEIKYPIIKFQ